jgi:hypothetical protein
VRNKDRFDSLDARATGIETRLTNIETTLGIAVPERKNVFVQTYEKVVNHKGTTALIALVGILASIFGSNLYRRHLEHQDRDFNTSVDGRIDTKSGPVITKLDGVTQRLATVEGKLDVLILLRAAAQPNDPNSASASSQVLQEARKNGAKLDANAVQQSGKAFIDAVSKEPATWDVALDFLNYRSFLNEPYSPDLQTKFTLAQGPKRQPSDQDFYMSVKPPLTFDISWPDELVPISQAFIFQPIGGLPFQRPGLSTKTQDHPFMMVHNPKGAGSIRLDGMHLRNVIFRDMRISYNGGPLIMKNVYFVNCTFEISHNPTGQKLATAILSKAPATDFTT